MNSPQASITTVDSRSCPLYQAQDRFECKGIALFPPEYKPLCLVLAGDILKQDFQGPDSPRQETPFDCSGCTGDASFVYTPDRAAQATSGPNRQIDNISKILSKFSMFQSIAPHQIARLVKMLKLTQFKEGEFIIRKGDPGRRLYIILSGAVEVIGDHNVKIAVLKKGEVFGEMSLLSGDPVGANIKVMEPTKILYFQSRDFRKVLHEFPSLQLYLAKLLTQRLARTNLNQFSGDTAGISGTLSETPPPEICQTININQKTGILTLHLPNGDAAISFRDGDIVKAEYGRQTGKDAFFEVLKDTEGRFSFHPGLSPEEMKMRELGHFMCLLMEGVSRVDEASHVS